MPYKTREDRLNGARFAYNRHKKLHQCTKCGKQDAYTLNGRVLCYECNEKKLKTDRKNYNSHRDNYNKSKRRVYQERKEKGICPMCGKRKANSGHVYCDICRAYMSRHKKSYSRKKGKLSRQEAYEYGFCTLCHKQPHMKDKKLCPECYEKVCANAAKARTVYLENKQKNGHYWSQLNDLIFQKTAKGEESQ